jgi:hypothetical protein
MAENETGEKPLTTGEWFVTLLILALPLVGLVMHFVWAFGDGNIGRKNFCRAALLWLAIALCLAIVGLVAFLVLGGTLAMLLDEASRR